MTNSDQDQTIPYYDVIIIGSGIAGLTAARIIRQSGHNCLILDKGRRIGGRCATRRQEGVIFHHGAQFFTAKDPEFRTLIDQATQAGAVAEWVFGQPDMPQERRCYVGTPTMRDFANFLGQDIAITQSVQITAIERRTKDLVPHYHLISDDGTRYHAKSVIVTVPAPQAELLVQPVSEVLAATAAQARYAPCWTVMIALNKALDHNLVDQLPLRASAASESVLGWASYEPARPQANSNPPALTLQAAPEASQKMINWDKEDVIAAMIDAFHQATNSPITSDMISFTTAHRWLYAKVEQAASSDLAFADHDGSLLLAGDWFGPARIESAFIAGRRAARHYLAASHQR